MFDLSNGCDSCSSFGMNDVQSNGMMQMDQNSQYLANMVSPQMNNNMMANNSMNNNAMANNANAVNSQLQQAMNNNVAVANNANAVMVNNVANNANNANNVNVPVVVNTDNANNKHVVVSNVNNAVNANNKKSFSSRVVNFVMLGLVVVAALAWNETAKYHINQAIKFNEGSPMYYVGYAVVATLFAAAAHNYMKN